MGDSHDCLTQCQFKMRRATPFETKEDPHIVVGQRRGERVRWAYLLGQELNVLRP